MITETIRKLLYMLEEENLDPYIYAVNARKTSYYIKFKDDRLGSLRVSDHNSRARYFYRWELRFDLEKEKVINKKHNQFFYPVSMMEKLVSHMRNYACKIVKVSGEYTKDGRLYKAREFSKGDLLNC